MPKVHSKKLQYKSKIFEIYDVDLEFSNGKRVTYEVLYKDTKYSVMIVPVDDRGQVHFVNEYHGAVDRYEICLPKGGVNYQEDPPGQTAHEAANKELQEEIGMKAGKLIYLGRFTTSPGSINKATEVFLALDLTPSKIEGDEPEELEVVKYPLEKFEQLFQDNKLNESRAIAALYLARAYLARQAKD
jgi:ADP-ribose diphosphatase